MDEDGVVQARCVLRLLLQKQEKSTASEPPRVVLFLEKMYCKMILNKVTEKISSIFQEFAKQLAKELGTILVSVREGYEKVW